MAVPDILLCFFPDCGKYQRFYHLSPSVSISVCFLVCDAVPVLVSVFAPVSTTALKCVLTPVPVPILGSSSSLHPCSRSSPRPVPSPVPVPITVQAPFTAPDTVHSFPPFELDYLLDKTRVYRYRTLRTEPVECPQAPLPVCRGNATRKKNDPVVNQKRIAAKDVLLATPPPGAGTRWSAGVYLGPVHYLINGEILDESMHVRANLTMRRHNDRKEVIDS